MEEETGGLGEAAFQIRDGGSNMSSRYGLLLIGISTSG